MSGCRKDLGIGRKGETRHKGVGPLGDDSQPSGHWRVRNLQWWFELGAGEHDCESVDGDIADVCREQPHVS